MKSLGDSLRGVGSVYSLRVVWGLLPVQSPQGCLVPLMDKVLLSSLAQLSISQYEVSGNAPGFSPSRYLELFPTSVVRKAFHEI